ncbi:MAG: hypothetical protein N3B13_07970, partial [Deltaproteobacteria bacterium]|nr:hypothetical protein [Deltaproteobacteria bacterium]
MKVYIETLGCKVNFADSAGLAAILANNGYMVTTDPHDAELFIINSCSVTHRAERECRQLARRFHSFNPSAKIIITGCSALSETFRKRADDIPFSHLISTDNILSELNLERREDAVHYYNRSRPFIKIQEGCDRFCSYCIVPYLRGKPRSISRRTISSQIHDALKNG